MLFSLRRTIFLFFICLASTVNAFTFEEIQELFLKAAKTPGRPDLICVKRLLDEKSTLSPYSIRSKLSFNSSDQTKYPFFIILDEDLCTSTYEKIIDNFMIGSDKKVTNVLKQPENRTLVLVSNSDEKKEANCKSLAAQLSENGATNVYCIEPNEDDIQELVKLVWKNVENFPTAPNDDDTEEMVPASAVMPLTDAKESFALSILLSLNVKNDTRRHRLPSKTPTSCVYGVVDNHQTEENSERLASLADACLTYPWQIPSQGKAPLIHASDEKKLLTLVVSHPAVPQISTIPSSSVPAQVNTLHRTVCESSTRPILFSHDLPGTTPSPYPTTTAEKMLPSKKPPTGKVLRHWKRLRIWLIANRIQFNVYRYDDNIKLFFHYGSSENWGKLEGKSQKKLTVMYLPNKRANEEIFELAKTTICKTPSDIIVMLVYDDRSVDEDSRCRLQSLPAIHNCHFILLTDLNFNREAEKITDEEEENLKMLLLPSTTTTAAFAIDSSRPKIIQLKLPEDQERSVDEYPSPAASTSALHDTPTIPTCLSASGEPHKTLSSSSSIDTAHKLLKRPRPSDSPKDLHPEPSRRIVQLCSEDILVNRFQRFLDTRFPSTSTRKGVLRVITSDSLRTVLTEPVISENIKPILLIRHSHFFYYQATQLSLKLQTLFGNQPLVIIVNDSGSELSDSALTVTRGGYCIMGADLSTIFSCTTEKIPKIADIEGIDSRFMKALTEFCE
ncbi:hypothetical protein FJ366_03730 [Candidatus Dependentiae bacterium]|nr:hypothetical protein [Candidatus Dependentiae bacterium]